MKKLLLDEPRLRVCRHQPIQAIATRRSKFGGKDMKTQYVTARTSLYAVPMEAVGHVFPAGGK